MNNSTIKFYYKDVPKLGNVAVSRHALSRIEELNISKSEFEDTLFNGSETPDGMEILFLDKKNIRLVIILKPFPFKGAKLVKTVIRLQEQARAISK